MFDREESNLSLLVGKTLTSVTGESDGDEMVFACDDGSVFHAYHMQDCCESVSIYDIKGSLQDIAGSVIVETEESEDSTNWPDDADGSGRYDSFTWTTHRIKAENGLEVIVRWLGVSNGYYSEGVHFKRTHARMPLNVESPR